MRIITTDIGVEIKLYSDSRETTIDRFTEFNKYLCIESGIGSSIESINQRYQRLEAFIKEDKKDDALLENENALFCVRSILSGISYTALSFACLVAEIGGEKLEDLTEEGLQRTVARVVESGITQKAIEEAIYEIKKK